MTNGGGGRGGGGGDLSTGSKVGIGVGAGVGGASILSALGFLLYRRGKAAGRKGTAGGVAAGGAAELSAKPRPTPELDGQAVSEMYAAANAIELGNEFGYDDYQINPGELSSATPEG